MNPSDAYAGYFQNQSLPAGYTPGTLSSYFSGQMAPIQQQTAQNVGSAQTSAVARGLAGTPTETGAMGTAQYYGNLAGNSAMGNLSMNMAGLSNQDQLITNQQNWQAGQNTQQQNANMALAQLGYNFQGGMANTMNRYGYQSGIAGVGTSLLGGGATLGAMYGLGAFDKSPSPSSPGMSAPFGMPGYT